MAAHQCLFAIALLFHASLLANALESGHRALSSSFSTSPKITSRRTLRSRRSVAELPPSQLSADDAATVLKIHNDARVARNVLAPLVYNNTLAAEAQRWVGDLITDGACGPANSEGEYGSSIDAENAVDYGQNVFYGWYNNATSPPPFNTTFAVGTWLARQALFRSLSRCFNKQLVCFSCKDGAELKCDNYIQMVFQTVKSIGCGTAVCEVPSTQSANSVFLKIFVCDYHPKSQTGVLPFPR